MQDIARVGDVTPAEAAFELLERKAARVNLLEGMRFCWRGGDREPLIVGMHTRGISAAITRGVNRLAEGLSTYLDIRCPVRHGKSDCSSRYGPAWIVGKLWHLHPNIILMGGEESLALSFSRDIQAIMAEPTYQVLFPGVRINPKRSAVEEWATTGSRSSFRFVGRGSSIMGRGGKVIIMDDWCRTREEAESADLREKVWKTFTNELMMRRADPCLVIVVATPWHVDGLQGRIDDAMERDKNFPRFERVHFRAREMVDGQYRYLFPERFSSRYYEEQYALLTPYEAAGLLDCDPVSASGTAAKRAWFKRVESFNPTGKKVRYWDTAATKKKTSDFTCGVLGGMDGADFGIKHIHKVRVSAGEVGDTMMDVARMDGFDVEVWIECEKGAMGLIGPAELAKPLLAAGYAVNLAIRPTGSKLCVWMPWFQDAKRQYAAHGGMPVEDGANVEEMMRAIDSAPDTPHDDDLDAGAGAYRACNGMIESEAASVGMRVRSW